VIAATVRSGVLLIALLGLTGCGVDGLAFVEDDRVSIAEPADRATVELPMTVRWSVGDFRVTGPTGAASDEAGYFGVFLDRAPQAPGRTVNSLARGDAACKVDPACPNETYFAGRGVYTTEDTELTIDSLPDLAQGDTRDFHELTIVLLNGEGKRVGESAFRREFEVAREDS
jgi:hypothetical protein